MTSYMKTLPRSIESEENSAIHTMDEYGHKLHCGKDGEER